MDLDGSGTITPSDFSPWLKQFFSGIYLAAYDYNNDGVLTLTDFSLLICEYWVCH